MGRIVWFGESSPIARGSGIETVVLTPEPLEGQCFVMGITSFPPGTSIPLHCHNTVEQVTLVEGEGMVELGGELHPVVPYDTTQVPAGEFHRFINTGSGRMRILWVYGSTTVTRTFAETGETVPQFGGSSV
jgi:quercetin dioxygenase-like cupin family protein